MQGVENNYMPHKLGLVAHLWNVYIYKDTYTPLNLFLELCTPQKYALMQKINI